MNNLKDNLNEIRRRILLCEASRWVGSVEEGADNHGQLVKMFQSSVGGKPGDKWCAFFVHYCLKHADRLFNAVFELRPEDSHLVWPSGRIS